MYDQYILGVSAKEPNYSLDIFERHEVYIIMATFYVLGINVILLINIFYITYKYLWHI